VNLLDLDVDLLRYGKRVVHIDAEIANRTLNFGMAKQS